MCAKSTVYVALSWRDYFAIRPGRFMLEFRLAGLAQCPEAGKGGPPARRRSLPRSMTSGQVGRAQHAQEKSLTC